VDSTTADSFDLFYGLYKFNKNSRETIRQLQAAMSDVVVLLNEKEKEEQEKNEDQLVSGSYHPPSLTQKSDEGKNGIAH
jgi:hypothetical protein